MVPHLHYCEPFAGGLAVLLNRDPLDPRLLWPHPCSDGRQATGVSELVSDLDGDLIGFYRVLRDPASLARLERRLQLTPLSEREWHAARDALAAAGADPVERAAHFFVFARQSRSGRRAAFTGLSRTRLRNVAALARPALEVIRSQ